MSSDRNQPATPDDFALPYMVQLKALTRPMAVAV